MKRFTLKRSLRGIKRWFIRLPEFMGGEIAITKAELSAKVIKADGTIIDKGVICRRKVTEAFVADIVGALAASGDQTNFVNFKYHDCGTGATAENNSDSALGTPYGGARATGTQVEGGTADARTYQSVGTISFSGTFAITEHGLFNASSSGTLMDRSVFSAINVLSGDSIQFTYTLTVNTEA